MSFKLLSFIVFCLFSFSAPQTSAPKIKGKYGKIDREHGEYVCLELFGDQSFMMSIRSCNKDSDIDGQYTFDGSAVYLTSTKQPLMKIAKIDSEKSADEQVVLTFTSNDAPLMQKIKVQINDDKKSRSPNADRQIISAEPIENITITFGELKVSHRFRMSDQSHTLHLTFEHLSEMTMKKQAWKYSKKKLILTDESGTQITLKKSRKCWFDYKFKGEWTL